MAYDAARSQIVVFGGEDKRGRVLDDTWTWDGTDWTQHALGYSPPPREGIAVAYDAARRQVVLFGGCGRQGRLLRDTWTWNGTNWSRHSPVHRPSARWRSETSSRNHVMLFGGLGNGDEPLGDTWTWDGADWTRHTSAHLPGSRFKSAMAFDAVRGQVLMFGGAGPGFDLGDTWTWDGVDWNRRIAGSMLLTPRSGERGSALHIDGWGFARSETVDFAFIDSAHGDIVLGDVSTDWSGGLRVDLTIPANATRGKQRIRAVGQTSGAIATQGFTVT